MILVDRTIKQRASEIFVEGYNEANVTSISYDLHILGIIVTDEPELKESYALRPGEFIFIKTKEKISMPRDLMGRIGEKNSRIRQGLSVSGPHYYPGHETYMYLRVKNETQSTITIREEDSIAQLFFEKLDSVPDTTYDQQSGASFNNEDDYRGLGRYRDEYEQRKTEMEDTNKNLDKRINNIYANILTIMGLFVSIFSIIMVNFTNISKNNLTKEFLIPMNLSLGIVITLFIGLLLLFINKADNKRFLYAFLGILIALIVALFIFI